jgi:hypothetical protein
MNKQLKQLNAEIIDLNNRKNVIFKKKQAELKSKYDDLFVSLGNKVEIRPCGGSLETIGFDNPNLEYQKELFKISLNQDYQTKKYTLDLGYYASRAETTDEFERLELLGIVAGIVKTNTDTIINTREDIIKKYQAKSNLLRDQVWSLEADRSKLFNSIKENAFNEVVAKAEADFIELPLTGHWRNDEIKVGGGLKVYNPYKIKINSYLNKSKKTANVTVLSIDDVYNREANGYEKVQRSETYPKVRLEWLSNHFNALARKSVQKQTNDQTA